MKKLFFLALWLIATLTSAQNIITNVDFRWQSETEKVIITYNLNLCQACSVTNAKVYISLDGGKTYRKVNSVTGDLTNINTSGNKQIIFDIFKEFGNVEVSGNVQFKVEIDYEEPKQQPFEPEMIFVKGNKKIKDFYIGKYEVTQAQWKAVMDNNPSHFKGDNLPVEKVSWNDAQEFIRKLNAKTGKNYRLPTEAEWEFAAKGGTLSKGYEYSGSNNVNYVAWYIGNSGRKTHPVGTKKPNELGIYDMSGNVWEWCQDFYESGSSLRVIRCGSWGNGAPFTRVSARNSGNPSLSYIYYGFRLACSSE